MNLRWNNLFDLRSDHVFFRLFIGVTDSGSLPCVQSSESYLNRSLRRLKAFKRSSSFTKRRLPMTVWKLKRCCLSLKTPFTLLLWWDPVSAWYQVKKLYVALYLRVCVTSRPGSGPVRWRLDPHIGGGSAFRGSEPGGLGSGPGEAEGQSPLIRALHPSDPQSRSQLPPPPQQGKFSSPDQKNKQECKAVRYPDVWKCSPGDKWISFLCLSSSWCYDHQQKPAHGTFTCRM